MEFPFAFADDELPETFARDGYRLTPEMAERYGNAAFMDNTFGNTAARPFKNARIYDVTGRFVYHGDFGADDVQEMYGVFYVLSEHTGAALHVRDIRDVKRNAFARIIDGEIQTSRRLVNAHYGKTTDA